MDMKTLEIGDVLVFVGNFCLSYQKELIVNVVTETKVIAEDMRGSEQLYNSEQLSDYIKKEIQK